MAMVLVLVPLIPDMVTMSVFQAGPYQQLVAAPSFLSSHLSWALALCAVAVLTPSLATFVLTRPVESPRLVRVEYIPPYYYVHQLRLAELADVDSEVEGWLAEAYAIGEQRHVSEPDWVRQRQPPDWVHVP